ncbi:hypothetical protein ACFWBF_22570 [Streptomyces sp. NPDC060028]|uniref:hypothetical protein n=1 Tax=Streptomyces sp. NPDC060028 TaxID=3347041 RepID=UPI0036CB3EFB
MTVSNVRNSNGSRFTIAILALLVLVLALYGGVRLVTGDDSHDSGHVPEAERVVLRDAAQVLPVLPGLGSLPTGWSVKTGFPGTMQCPAKSPGCDGSSISAASEYVPASMVDQVRIELRSYPTIDAATVGYKALAKQQVDRGSGLDPLSLPDVGGDEVIAVAWRMNNDDGSAGTAATGATSVVRVGTVAVTVFLRDEGAGGTSLEVLQTLTATMAARAREAISGQTPQTGVQL